MNLRRILPYLILNVVVSASVTLAVLWFWDSSRHIDVPVFTPMPALDTPAPEITASLPPLDKPVIQIQNVYGVGDLSNEKVVLSRQGEGDLELTGWQLKDELNHTFTFPRLLLNQDGAVQVYTRSGPDSVIELHWGLEQAIWRSGMTVSLVDPLGNLRASYRIP